MKIGVLLLFGCFLVATNLKGQDKIILVSGDTLPGKVIRQSSSHIVFLDGSIERELKIQLIGKIILQSGREVPFRNIPANLDFQRKFMVFKHSEEILSEINLLFPSAQTRSYSYKHLASDYVAPIERFNAATDRAEAGDVILKDFITYGYGCNAFLALVDPQPGSLKFTYFFNPVSADRIRKTLPGRSFKLVDSQTVGELLGLFDLSLKDFTMTFKPDGICDFYQGAKLTVLQYDVSNEGDITFKDPKKRGKGTTYRVVFLDENRMRYTQYSTLNDNILTREVEAVATQQE